MVTEKNRIGLGASWKMECFIPSAEWTIRWVEYIPENLVVTAGLSVVLDRTFKTIPVDVNWFVGLKGAGTPVAGDTMSSHPSWAEITPYSNATRPAFTPGAISGGQVDNAGSTANFTINAGTTVSGIFATTNNVKAGTTGTLYSSGDFTVPRVVVIDDVLSVTLTLRATAL